MLQRAASNAYSWWWASHIRTNQSKWLDNNLQDMEKRVKSMLKIIEEDADSFAKRAEMYYKKRPELISFVEETYRAYRALAERYDRISGELHKANHTLATAFPDVQFPMQDEDDENSPKAVASIDSTKIPKPLTEYPQIRVRNKNSENKQASKVSQPRRIASQISEEEAKEAIDRLQKGILVLQTEKEFIKSSCDSGMTKYWEIEKQITEMQDEVCFLQDEFSASSVIEDDEARALMAMTALRSCKDTLVNLQELQKRSVEETRIESERIKVAKEKLRALKGESCQQEIGEISDGNTVMSTPTRNTGEDACDLHPESLELQLICKKVKDHFEISSNTSVVELAEKIDELVNKVISLELTVSSQTAQIKRLRSETDELQKHLRGLEEERVSSTDDSNGLSGRLNQAENELHKIESLEKRVQYGKTMLHTDLTEACLSLNDVSERLQSPKHQDQVKIATQSQEERSLINIEPQKDSEEEEVVKVQDTRDNVEEETREFQEQHSPPVEQDQVQSDPGAQLENDSEKFQSPSQEDKVGGEEDSLRANDGDRVVSSEPETQVGEQEDSPNLQKLLLSGLEGREKVLLAEYTSILRNYKETKKKLLDVERKNQEYFSETMTQVRELKSANAVKDDEIRSLRQILRSLQTCSSFVGTLESPLTPLNSEVMTEDVAKGDTPLRVQDRGGLYADDDIKPYRIIDETQATPSPIEEKFRRDIDTLLDENLEFWLRFSTSFHQIQRFRTEFQGLQADSEKLKDSKAEGCNSAGSEHGGNPARSAPVEKQLRELKTELQVWLEQNVLLRGELQSRFSSLCNIKEEISGALKKAAGSEGGQFTPCQAAKFQGEVLNMQQENNKVADELQAGLDHVRGLQVEVDRILSKIHDKFELSSSKSGHHHHHHFRHFSSKSRGIPLRSFLYGVKPKKPSIFSCMNPALQKQYSDLRGLPI